MNMMDEFYIIAYEKALYKERMKYYDRKIKKIEFTIGDVVLLFDLTSEAVF